MPKIQVQNSIKIVQNHTSFKDALKIYKTVLKIVI